VGRFGESERKQNNAEISACVNKIAVSGGPESICGDVEAIPIVKESVKPWV
jgi:hypothetical protein